MSNSKNDTPDDFILVKSIRSGDKDSFKILYYKYFEKLIRFVWYRTHSMDSARDFVQEIFSKVWSRRKYLDPNKSIKAYLYKSVNNLIIDSSKLAYTKSESIDNNKKVKSLQESRDIELEIDIKSAVENLPEKLREVYTLSRYDGFKYAEIAEICEISVKTVEKRMTQAFNILRRTFPKKYFNL